jgi:hypothetical protein
MIVPVLEYDISTKLKGVIHDVIILHNIKLVKELVKN